MQPSALSVSDSCFFDYCGITENTSASNQSIWHVRPPHIAYELPTWFVSLLDDHSLALVPGSPFVTSTRPRVDAILHHTLALAKIMVEKNADMYSCPPFNVDNISKSLVTFSWAYEQHICLPDTFQSEGKILECVADYIFWYGEASNLETNLIVIRAEKPVDKYQYLSVLAAMSLVQHNRNKTGNGAQGTYGIITNGFEWVFLYLNSQNQYSSLSLNWMNDQPKAIVSQLYKILNEGITMKLLRGFESRWIPSTQNQPKFTRNNTDSDINTELDQDTDSDFYSDIDSNTEDTTSGFTTAKMDWLNRLEKKVKSLTTRVKDDKLQREVDEAFTAARRESQETKALVVPSLAVTEIPAQDVEKTFDLKRNTNPGQIWQLRPEERRAIPDYLRAILADYDLALGDSTQNEAFIRARVDAILLTTLARKKRQEFGQYGQDKDKGKRASVASVESFKSLHWQFERQMKLQRPYRNKTYIINGKTDYSLWYGDARRPESNLVIVETKQRGVDGKYQCMTYMGILYHIRKQAGRQNTDIYGIGTDSFEWTFIQLNREGKISTHSLSWIEGKGSEIIFHIHKIMDDAAILSPVPSQGPSRRPTK
ncbi:hypothetical protein BDV39DRAFT_200977 [Aspergillus sergii]|uniref:Uncharacterized protein n=1 Tax=Aspergillus sergii TaxID=1034303 RepID=A0A5N6XDI9_9EURO|nr:hypothetical protein BDV39DRAFT_200977 [Aspergillus sergii]